MKTYMVQKHNTSCSEKREIKPPVIRELNEKPRDDYHRVIIPNNTPDYTDRFNGLDYTMTQFIFEAHRLITMIWVEDHQVDDISFGYYNSFVSYFQVPEGTNAGDMFGIQEGEDVYNRLNTQPYIRDELDYNRQRVFELERRLQELERIELAVEREGLPVIHTKPIPKQYFDETIFELE